MQIFNKHSMKETDWREGWKRWKCKNLSSWQHFRYLKSVGTENRVAFPIFRDEISIVKEGWLMGMNIIGMIFAPLSER